MHFERPAVFLLNGRGDQLLALPAMRALATIFAGGVQLFIGQGMYEFFYRGLPVGEPVRAWWKDRGELSIDVERIAARAKTCDLFVCLSTIDAPSIAELARKLEARWSVGFFDMFDQRVHIGETTHMFDALFDIARVFRSELRFDDFSHAPTFSPAAERAATRFVRAHVSPGERILFVHPETLPGKMWDAAALSWVVAHFLDGHPEFKVFVSSIAPHRLEIGRHQPRLVRVDHHLELALAMLRHADLFLGVDSCFLHAADLFRIPGVALFGPTEPRHWSFRISPATRSVWGEGSMERIRREDVFDALTEIGRCLPETTCAPS